MDRARSVRPRARARSQAPETAYLSVAVPNRVPLVRLQSGPPPKSLRSTAKVRQPEGVPASGAPSQFGQEWTGQQWTLRGDHGGDHASARALSGLRSRLTAYMALSSFTQSCVPSSGSRLTFTSPWRFWPVCRPVPAVPCCALRQTGTWRSRQERAGVETTRPPRAGTSETTASARCRTAAATAWTSPWVSRSSAPPTMGRPARAHRSLR